MYKLISYHTHAIYVIIIYQSVHFFLAAVFEIISDYYFSYSSGA